MSDGADLGRVAVLRTLSPTRRWLRLVILLAPAAVLAAIDNETGHVAAPVVIVVAVLAVASALIPDGHAGLGTILLLTWYWGASVDRPTSALTLLAALAMLLFHTAMAASTVAPPAARWTRTMHRRWAARTAVAGAALVAAWVLARVLATATLDGSTAMLAAALAVLAATAAWIRFRSVPRSAGAR